MIEIGAGKADKNALGLLGIAEGVAHATRTSHERPCRTRRVSFATPARGLVEPTKLPAASALASAGSGKVPTWIKDQIANYQAA